MESMIAAPRLRLALVLALLAMSSAHAAPPAPNWPDYRNPNAKPQPGDPELLREADAALHKQCPGLDRYKRDLDAGASYLSSAAAGAFVHDSYGWERYLTSSYRVHQRAESIPAEYHVNGHLCEFRVALQGTHPGVDITRQECASLCLDRHVSGNGKNTTFVPLPASDVKKK